MNQAQIAVISWIAATCDDGRIGRSYRFTAMFNIVRGSFALVLVCAMTIALAHTAAISTTPKSGAVLDQSPPSVEITFKEAAHLTSAVVAHEGESERKLSFSPEGSATKFTIEAPQLKTGKSEIRWTALSKDGHVVKGTIALTVKPAAAP